MRIFLACPPAARSTCFWAGDTLAPKLRIDRPKRDGSGHESVGIQAYLQEAFLDAIDVLVAAVGDLQGVVGFEVGPCEGSPLCPLVHVDRD